MTETTIQLELLLEKATNYGQTSFELAKLKALDKGSDIASSALPQSIAVALIASALLFLNIGVAIWLSELLESSYYGFFIVAGAYLFLALFVSLFMHKWIKKMVSDYIVKTVLK